MTQIMNFMSGLGRNKVGDVLTIGVVERPDGTEQKVHTRIKIIAPSTFEAWCEQESKEPYAHSLNFNTPEDEYWEVSVD